MQNFDLIVRNKVYGSDVRIFEMLLSQYFDDAYVISTSSATVGLLGVLYSLNIRNHEVLTTPLTWPGALSPFLLLNNKIIFGSIEEPSLTLNPETIEKFITPNTKVIFTADMLGFPARLDMISKICNKYKILHIHDAASSIGSFYKNKYSGYYADITLYSFGRNKPFSLGEGGAVIIKNEMIYKQLIKGMTHPERQDIEYGITNPFFLNTAMNPLAVHYGIESFRKQLQKIEKHKNKMQKKMDWTKVFNDGIEYNYYRPYLKVRNNKKHLRIYDFPYVFMNKNLQKLNLNKYKILLDFKFN